MNNRQELLAALKSYIADWKIEGSDSLSLETALENNFDKLFADNHHIKEMLDLLKSESNDALRQTAFKNVVSQSLVFVKGNFHVGDKKVFVFNMGARPSVSKYQTLQKPKRVAYLLKRRRILAIIGNQLQTNRCLILRGRSGIGKSVLAENYYHEYAAEYDFLMWIPYDTDLPTSFIRHRDTNQIPLAHLIAELKSYELPPPEINRRCAEHIAKYWSDLKGRKLLILDGVQNADDLQPFHYLFNMDDCDTLITAQAFSSPFGAPFDVPKLTNADILTLADALTENENWDRNDLVLLAENTLLLDLALRQCPSDNPKAAENYLRNLHNIAQNIKNTTENTENTEGGNSTILNWLIEQAHLSVGHRWLLLQWAALPDNRYLELETFNRITNLEDKTIFHSPDFHLFKGNADKRRYKSDIEPFKNPDDYQTDLANRGWLIVHEDDTYSIHPTLRQHLIATYGIAWDYIAEQIQSLTTTFFIKEEVGYDDPDDDQSQKCQAIFEEHLAHFIGIVDSENTEGYRDLVAKYVVVLQARYDMDLLGIWLNKQLVLWETSKGEDATKTCEKRNYLGLFYLDTSNFDKALVLFEKNLTLFRMSKLYEGESVTLNQIGITYSYKGDKITALSYLELSLAISQKIRHLKSEAKSLINIATILQEKGSQDDIIPKYLERALEISRQGYSFKQFSCNG